MSNINSGKRAQWTNSIGFVLAAAGSAVGLGNIWRFPGKAYEGGGAAFLIIYIAIVAVIGSTVMLAELVMGRNTQKNTIGAYRQLRPKWAGWGVLSIVTSFIILCYYIQVGGWVIYYIFGYILKPAEIFANPTNYFLNMLGSDTVNGTVFFPWLGAVLCPLLFIGIAVYIIIRGVNKGIENFNKFGMPALFIILIILMIRSVTLPGAGEGIKFMLTPNFSTITPDIVLLALGQAFFSLSLGMAIMITYGSYVKKEENLAKSTAIICGMDTLVSFLAVFMIVPAVFATIGSENVGKGGSFAFIALAGVFEKMPAGVLFGILFYLLLFFSAITSAVSLLEGSVVAMTEQLKIDRKIAAIGLALIMFLIGIFYTISQVSVDMTGVWADYENGIFFPSFGDFMEYITDRLLIPLNALTVCILVGWVWDTKNGINEIRQDGKFRFKLAGIWSVSLKYIAIAAILIILVFGLVFGKSLS
ncbi:MAG: sodium-dependent transporter [Treponema sp.]|nr:sodium-dependent transporter [Treponema sp.]